MECSETRAARLGAERSRDQALEEKGMAQGKKNAARLGAHIVFADESGFLLVPTVARTWAPRGKTPIHRHRQGQRDKLSVISGISVSPKRHHLGLYYLLFYENIGQEEVCVFLRELLRHLRGPIIVLLERGQVCVLQVTDATANAIQLRALVDARDAGAAWDLRCEVREKLIQFLQETYPQGLPR